MDSHETIILTDEDGKEEEFEYLDTFEMDDSEYVVLLPVGQERSGDENEEAEIVILKVVQEEEEEMLEGIEDEEELEAVYEKFQQRAEEEYDFCDE